MIGNHVLTSIFFTASQERGAPSSSPACRDDWEDDDDDDVSRVKSPCSSTELHKTCVSEHFVGNSRKSILLTVDLKIDLR